MRSRGVVDDGRSRDVVLLLVSVLSVFGRRSFLFLASDAGSAASFPLLAEVGILSKQTHGGRP